MVAVADVVSLPADAKPTAVAAVDAAEVVVV
jgi:hypothetical protein